MTIRERVALTILLETYLNIPADFYFDYDYGLNDRGIGCCIKFLLDENVLTTKELSRELRGSFGIAIAPLQLKRYGEQRFSKFVIRRQPHETNR